MKIKKGDVINELSLPSVDGSVFDLESIKGKKSLISFYRYSSCPFCHLRINETINNKENFGENFETIAVFNCTLESLQKSSTKHDSSIYILAVFIKFMNMFCDILPFMNKVKLFDTYVMLV